MINRFRSVFSGTVVVVLWLSALMTVSLTGVAQADGLPATGTGTQRSVEALPAVPVGGR